MTDVKGLESLSKLTVLNLRENKLSDGSTILQSNGSFGCSNLRELDLRFNNLHGMIPSWLGNCTSLQFLDLSQNHFEGNLALSPVSYLSNLEYLIVSDNILEIPVSLTSFYNHSNLKVLAADNNRLLSEEVEFHLPRLIPKFQLQLLSFLNCLSNHLITRLPDFLYYQSDLRILDLSQINLGVPFPTWLVENNTLLEQCYMRNNSLSGSFLFLSHQLFPKTTVIDISNNHLVGKILENVGRIFPGLEMLDMSGNLFGGRVPTSTGKLEMLDLSHNNLVGEIPKTMVIDWPSLSFLGLSHNSLSGQLFPALYNLTSLRFLYLDSNHFAGEIPDSFPAFSLWDFDLSNNHISGKLPRWIGNMTVLRGLAIASNHLEGSLPTEFCNLGNYFEFLDLSDNDLSGSIPSCFNPPRIWHVHLNRKRLSGPMTRAFHNSTSMVILDFIDNNLTGAIPSWIGNLPLLSVLLLKLNNFEGEIPQQLCNLKSLGMLDLSQNNLSGQLPLCLSDLAFGMSHKSSEEDVSAPEVIPSGDPSKLRTIYNFHEYPTKFFNSKRANQQVEFSTKFVMLSYKGIVLDLMSGIDISCNHLTGEIPAEIGNLSNIHALNLSHNHLTGPIPMALANLTAIESLDLSYNNLNGRIPPQLVKLGSLETFSVAHNNLSGPLPDQKAQFKTFDEKSYEGNPLLCGPPLINSCSTKTRTGPGNPLAPEEEVERDGMVGFYAICVASYVLFLLFLYLCCYKKPMKLPSLPSPPNSLLKLTYQSLHEATNGFSATNVIGVGSFGSVYKGLLPQDQQIVVVKVLSLQHRGAARSFLAECEALRRIRHRNLLKVITACSSIDHQGNDFKALVYEYMPNGSLDAWLHFPESQDETEADAENLNLSQRIDIVIGVASAVEYLHHRCEERIVHCDLKPSNILLDHDMVAHVGDFGLAKLIHQGGSNQSSNNQSSTISLRGSVGYVAPEYGMGNEVSTFGDVYSYGIIVLEIFTGKRPTDHHLFNGCLNLRDHVEMALPEQVETVVDPRLLMFDENVDTKRSHTQDHDSHRGSEKMKECLVSLLRVGTACAQELPRDRMTINDAIIQLHAVKKALLRSPPIRSQVP